MKQSLVCFSCPNSCVMEVTADSDSISVDNNRCSRGIEFAAKELRDPERILTSTVKVEGGELPLASVRSNIPVKKHELKKLIQELDAFVIKAPVRAGAVIRKSAGENCADIIVTRTVKAV